MAQRLLPDDHPMLATSLNNVADCLVSLDRHAEALPKYEQSLAMTQRLFPGDHPDVAYHLNKVAFCLDSLGRSAEALTKFEEALAMRRRFFAPDHWHIAVTQIGLGSALGQNGRFAEGEALMVPAWEVIVNRADVSLRWKRRCLHCFIRLYEAWDAAEPGQGYAAKAAAWRGKLDELPFVP
jgi:tetratricopeptide (TPR) repeat protein